MRRTLLASGVCRRRLRPGGLRATVGDPRTVPPAPRLEHGWPSEITLALIPNEQVNDLVTSAEAADRLPLQAARHDGQGRRDQGLPGRRRGGLRGQAQIAIADAGSLAAAQDQCGAFPVLQDVRYGASSYASEFFTNIDNASKYCTDTPVEATYAANGEQYLYCNGVASGDKNTGVGPVGVDALKKITPGTKVAFGNTTSPAGYQLPVLALEKEGVKVDRPRPGARSPATTT